MLYMKIISKNNLWPNNVFISSDKGKYFWIRCDACKRRALVQLSFNGFLPFNDFNCCGSFIKERSNVIIILCA